MTTKNLIPSALFLCLLAPAIHAQNYSIDWYNVAGGGGTSSGGPYSLSATIGQPDASGPMTGGNYSLSSGFWSIISVVQTAGLPNLSISYSGNTVTVSWPNTGAYILQQNSNLSTPGGWSASGYAVNTNSGASSITVTPPTGSLFFRLAAP